MSFCDIVQSHKTIIKLLKVRIPCRMNPSESVPLTLRLPVRSAVVIPLEEVLDSARVDWARFKEYRYLNKNRH
jgi:hypothetical protein